MRSHLRHVLILLLASAVLPLFAQEKGGATIVDQLKQNTTFGGYVIGRINGTTSDDANVKADMGLRIVRLYVDTRLGDFAFKLQMQVNGNTSGKPQAFKLLKVVAPVSSNELGDETLSRLLSGIVP